MPLNGNQAELLAYWYFRLNGYLTIKDFVVHPDIGIGQRTDIDVLGVRFPHRRELFENTMVDDEKIIHPTKIQIVFAEVKAGICTINNSWTEKARRNIERFLKAVGIVIPERVEDVAEIIYRDGKYEDDTVVIEIVVLGLSLSNLITAHFPRIKQIIWTDILSFIYYRFRQFNRQKRDHDQWDIFGIELYQNAITSHSEREFIQKYL